MFPAPFAYIRAESVEHTLNLLRAHGSDARLLAGGHSLLPAMKLRLAQPRTLIDIGRLQELQYIHLDGQWLAIGALATHWQIESDPLVEKRAPALADAARLIADMQVRNRGTIGGALAHADPAADYPAALLALGAKLCITGSQGQRCIPIDQFFIGAFTTDLGPEEILTEIRIPPAAPGSSSVYRKFVRRAVDYGIAGVAAYISLDEAGICQEARIGITCVAAQPYRPEKAEALLTGRPLTAELIATAAVAATEGITPLEDSDTHGDYRLHLARLETRQALAQALQNIHNAP